MTPRKPFYPGLGAGVFLLLLLFGNSFSAWADEPSDLVYLTEDYPPENYLENGILKGYAVDVLKALWKKLGAAEQPIQVLPWARAYSNLERNTNTVLFATARTPDRERLFQWVGPIYQAKMSMLTLSTRLAAPKSLDQARGLTIGVINNDIAQTLLLDAGFSPENLAKVNNLTQLIRVLVAGRVDAIVTNEASLAEALIQDPTLPKKYRTLLVVEEVQVYYAFSKNTDPTLVGRFQKALTAIDAERRAIVRGYGLVESRSLSE